MAFVQTYWKNPLREMLFFREVTGLRGLLNANPSNIKSPPGKTWEGQIGADDQNHAIFADPVFGVRAQVRQITVWRARDGVKTLGSIVRKQTAVAEDWGAYEEALSRAVFSVEGQGARVLDWWEETAWRLRPSARLDMVALIRAMCVQENGILFVSDDQIKAGIELFQRGAAANPIR